MIYDLFPTAIGHYNFARAFSKDELDFFYNQVSRPNVGNHNHGVIIHPKANIIININMQILLFQAYSIFKQNLKEII